MRSEDHLSTVALQIEVELGGVRNVAIHDRPCRAIAAPVRIRLREESNVVALAHHDHGDLGLDAKTLACS